MIWDNQQQKAFISDVPDEFVGLDNRFESEYMGPVFIGPVAVAGHIDKEVRMPGGPMSAMYKSLKVIMQDTIQRGKANPTPLAPVEGRSASSLTDEVEQFEKTLADGFGKLKAAAKETEAAAAAKTQYAEQLVEGFQADIAALESQLRETEETLRRKDSARQEIEEGLTTKIHDLQNDVKKKEQALESRGNEINDLKSALDRQAKRIADLRLTVQKSEAEAANQAQRAEQLTGSSETTIAALKVQLRNAEEMVRNKESAVKELEQNLTIQKQAFESHMKKRDELLTRRDGEINDLQSQLKRLTKGIEQMSSFFRQTEGLAAVEGQDPSSGVTEPSKPGEEKPAFQPASPKVTPSAPDAGQEIVATDLLDRITSELAEVTGIMKPIAAIVVRDHVGALGESMEKFPKNRLPELLESLNEEVVWVTTKIGSESTYVAQKRKS